MNKGKKITIRFDAKVENSVPSDLIKTNLLLRSESQDFEEAKEEWRIDSIIDESSDGFSSCCQLCNTPRLKYNFILHNTQTNQQLAVGSTCIIRFKVVKGVVDVESGITLLQNIADEQYLKNKIQTNVHSMMVLTPEATSKYHFVKDLREYMSIRGINNPSDEQLGELFFGCSWEKQDLFKLERMRQLWNKPGYIDTYKAPAAKKDNNLREGTTWGHKRRTRVNTSLSSSRAYKTDKID